MVAIVVFASFCSSAGLAAKHKHRSDVVTPVDSDYVSALATANKFLQAWETNDLETGMVLLSDHIRHSQDPEKFEQFFAGSSDRAFEITQGQGKRGRYRFSVVLVTSLGTRVRRKVSAMVVVDSGKNDWVVDTLP